ncbi:CPBP family intramembrane glutamic endopeptidase [Mobilicoccus pelagius]|uniref:CAAX prenyl protease 2/Lysostaphin resistance protein A-like domain-containing protein n=1 Tax=Mobilicoccus pelagius NBRC 104925 TaxID=1089455 RepID=H5UNM8_9MICO|nr:CPBP family intramembrane glutamic endopeptidase [Mobilicoccus pelagius]GAB47336.1 hypothetical protein MOPEL_009_00260 [Mobilicoccus pelagius NBRC 104925]
MTEFVLLCLPSAVYVLVALRRGRGSEAWRRCGLGRGESRGYLFALALLVPCGLLAWAATSVIPAEARAAPGVTTVALSPLAAIGVALRAGGEEVFFRGLLGGLLIRRFGFTVGNLLQAGVFLLPHVALLLADMRLWPLLPIQFGAGLALGWLRHGHGSVWPGALVHTAVNLAPALL